MSRSDPLSALCQRCGLCCDGNLFTQVPLQGAETAAVRQHGLDVVERADGSPALVQRCAALKEGRCSIYLERPEGCRRYRCLLFAALADQELSLEEALAVVNEAQERISSLERLLLPAGQRLPRAVMQRARRAAQSDPGGLSPEARAAWERAEAFLAHHFHRP